VHSQPPETGRQLSLMELDVDEVPWKRRLLTRPYAIENGEFVLATGPGWGTEIDEDVLRAHPAKM
jgi:galactonate dehydratase